ncbi:hypothetical protein L1049_006970 [Liquidambar formosana]|uniref:Uncharacterized protein n=1 Tax=Liquidambar formosana TaxID=63359 RepID=A0AAP0RHV1_LIQFO
MEPSLLQRYRSDRRKLVEFILSSGLIKEVRTPSGPTPISDIDLDSISADYLLDCIKSGGVVDISEASKKYCDEFEYPVMIHSQLENPIFFSRIQICQDLLLSVCLLQLM